MGLAMEDEHDQLEAALHRVALWRGRSDRGGRLSHAIDMTAGLAGILLMDAQRSTVSTSAVTVLSPTTSLYQLRNAYSTLLLRSVNGLADTYRHQKKSALLSVSHCCALAGLPLWIVDVRHDASHNELPSLGVCRIAALESLRFWRGRYWESLEERVWAAPVKGWNGGVVEGMMNNNGPPSSASSSSSSQEGGIRTLAFDCLVRYQKAAMMEACEREERLRNQRQQQTRAMKNERRRQKEEEPNKNEHDVTMQDSIDVRAYLIGKTEAGEQDLIHVPSENDGKSKSMRGEKSNHKEPKRDDDNPIPDRQSRGAIPWGILNDDRETKKKKKKAKTDDPMEEGNANVAADNMAEKTDTSGAVNASAVPPITHKGNNTQPSAIVDASASVPSSRDCAAEFIRTIPIDTVFSMTLRFLVWGENSLHTANEPADENGNPRESDVAGVKNNSPALLTLPPHFVSLAQSPAPKEQLDAAFEQLRTMYDPLLIAMTNAYPGFVLALFVHLVDSILCLDAARGSCDELLDLKQLEHNIQYISRWIRYILSRDYHMHFDKSASMYVSAMAQRMVDKLLLQSKPLNQVVGSEQKQPLQPIDLKKKGRKKWTHAEFEYMQSPLTFSSLHEIGFPLNSVCDRLLLHQKDLSKCSASNVDSNASTAVEELQTFLEDVIGKERVLFMGIYDHKDMEVSTDRDHHPTKEKNWTKGEEQTPKNIVPDSKTDKEAPNEESKASHGDPLLTASLLSLADMEAMLGNADTQTDTDGAPAHSPDRDDGGHCMDGWEDTLVYRKPWALCEKWDACAIGTMPGYPG